VQAALPERAGAAGDNADETQDDDRIRFNAVAYARTDAPAPLAKYQRKDSNDMPEATWKPHEKHGRLKMQSDLPDSVYAFLKQRKETADRRTTCA
jgi:hypothetical protein